MLLEPMVILIVKTAEPPLHLDQEVLIKTTTATTAYEHFPLQTVVFQRKKKNKVTEECQLSANSYS